MSKFIHFLNGKFVEDQDLLLSPRDLGFTRGYAITDFIVTYNNKPFKLQAHIDRLFKSAKIVRLKLPWTEQQIVNWVNKTLDRNDRDGEKTIKIIVSGGVSYSMRQTNVPTLIMMVDDRLRKPTKDYKMGIKVVAIKYRRPFPEAKHSYYANAIKELADKPDDIAEIIYFDDSQVFEGAGTNLFTVVDDRLATPKSNVVSGITRNTLLEILKLPIPIETRDFSFEELLGASEVFLTGSNSEVRGVVEINGKIVGDGKVGKITKEVMRQYQKYIDDFKD